MSQTYKDAKRAATRRGVLHVIRKTDGNYDVRWNDKLVASNIDERWLIDELCTRFGFCGTEYDAILQELNKYGKATRSV